MIRVNRPGQLAGIERRGDLVVNLLQECLTQEEVLALLRVESAEEPKLVLDNRTADVNAGVDFREAIVRRSTG